MLVLRSAAFEEEEERKERATDLRSFFLLSSFVSHHTSQPRSRADLAAPKVLVTSRIP